MKDWREELEVKVEVGIVSAGGIGSIVGVGVGAEVRIGSSGKS